MQAEYSNDRSVGVQIVRTLCVVFGTLLIGAALIFPRAYGVWKLAVLVMLLFCLMLNHIARRVSVAPSEPVLFFVVMAVINAIALITGEIYGNSLAALNDGLRLGIVFPLIIAFLWSSLPDFDYRRFVNTMVFWSTLLIALTIVLGVLQELGVATFFSEAFVEENALRVGVHEGYLQVTSHNVGSLLFICGYLLYYVAARQDGEGGMRAVGALGIALLAAMISGRRALQFEILLAPFFLLVTAQIFADDRAVKIRITKACVVVGVLAVALLAFLFASGYFDFEGFLTRFSGVFEDDGGARTSQAAALFNGFLQRPVLGSGIGGLTEVVRSDESPWLYELTYMQLLFNFGLVGVLLTATLVFRTLAIIWRNARTPGTGYSHEVKAMFSGVVFLIFGAATNPYFGSFDFLLFLGALPFAAGAGMAGAAGQAREIMSGEPHGPVGSI